MMDAFARTKSPLLDLPGLSKVRSYVSQALIPLPDRLETYNYLHHFSIESVFNKQFLQDVDTEEPLNLLRERFAEATNASYLNRMLYLDWKFTLADNDLRKVNRMCEVAGVKVHFPFLDDELVTFSTRIASKRKLRGTALRHFFREAMRDFLPSEVLAKRKHGFSLPFGIWLIEDPNLRDFAYSSLRNLSQRDIFSPDFISRIRKAAEDEHAAYYGEMIWILIMLEEWLAAHH